jgi:hypothetical protein
LAPARTMPKAAAGSTVPRTDTRRLPRLSDAPPTSSSDDRNSMCDSVPTRGSGSRRLHAHHGQGGVDDGAVMNVCQARIVAKHAASRGVEPGALHASGAPPPLRRQPGDAHDRWYPRARVDWCRENVHCAAAPPGHFVRANNVPLTPVRCTHSFARLFLGWHFVS